MRRKSSENDDVLARLDVIINLLQDLFILEGVKLGIKTEELRKLVAINKNRISRISKHISKT